MNDATTPVEVDYDPDDGIIRISRRGACLPLTLAEAQQVICQVAGLLVRHHATQLPAAGRVVDLTPVEQAWRRDANVVDPRGRPVLLAILATASPPMPGRWP